MTRMTDMIDDILDDMPELSNADAIAEDNKRQASNNDDDDDNDDDDVGELLEIGEDEMALLESEVDANGMNKNRVVSAEVTDEEQYHMCYRCKRQPVGLKNEPRRVLLCIPCDWPFANYYIHRFHFGLANHVLKRQKYKAWKDMIETESPEVLEAALKQEILGMTM